MNRLKVILNKNQRFEDEQICMTRILIVEDNPDHATLAQIALNNYGFEHIDIAPTINKAFEKINTNDYDVLLVDYCLPDGYGLELIEWIKKNCVIIMMTGQEDEQVAVQTFKKGAYDYIIKDALFRHMLCEAVETALENKQSTVPL